MLLCCLVRPEAVTVAEERVDILITARLGGLLFVSKSNLHCLAYDINIATTIAVVANCSQCGTRICSCTVCYSDRTCCSVSVIKRYVDLFCISSWMPSEQMKYEPVIVVIGAVL